MIKTLNLRFVQKTKNIMFNFSLTFMVFKCQKRNVNEQQILQKNQLLKFSRHKQKM